MKSYILDPLINDPRFQSFYQLCSNALLLLQAGRIGSLRDLEKHLIFFADSQSSTHNPQLCLEFCKTVLKYLEGSLSQIPEVDLKRENDPLYTRGYFMDMGHQITERINSLVMNKEENSELQYAERWDNRLAILEAEEYTR